MVQVARRPEVASARSYRYYDLTVRLSALPAGVQVGFAQLEGGKANVSWGKRRKD